MAYNAALTGHYTHTINSANSTVRTPSLHTDPSVLRLLDSESAVLPGRRQPLSSDTHMGILQDMAVKRHKLAGWFNMTMMAHAGGQLLSNHATRQDTILMSTQETIGIPAQLMYAAVP
jgi:hypothetical protein